MSTENSPLPSLPWKTLGSVGALLGAAVLMYVFTPQQKTEGPGITGNTNIDVQIRSEKELARVLTGMRAGRLDSLQDRLTATDDLNRWADDFPLPADKPLAADADTIQRIVPQEFYANVINDRFLPADAAHIRIAMLAGDAVASITAKHPQQPGQSAADYETELVAAVFAFVWENVAEDQQQKPFTPYDILMLGRGTTSDRIWCFSEFVRQLGLDTVLIAPTQKDLAAAVLVGVITTEKEVLLFEPTIGIPLFNADQEATHIVPKRPVTLLEARENPAILDQLNYAAVPPLQLPATEYPLTSEILKDVKVLIVASPSECAPRMAHVEYRLPADISAHVYAGLGANALRPDGILDRVIAAGQQHGLWTAESVALWAIPFALEPKNEEMRADSQSEFSNLSRILAGPMVPTVDGSQLQAAENTLEEVRVEQISGSYATALSHLLPIRNANHRVKMPVNQFAADFATYRAAQCQIQLGQLEAAETTLTAYLSDPQGGQLWMQEAIEEMAWLRMHNAAAADVQTAPTLPSPFTPLSQAPRASLRNLFLLHYWYRFLQAQGKLPANAPSTTPNTPDNPPATGAATTTPAVQPPTPPLPERFPAE